MILNCHQSPDTDDDDDDDDDDEEEEVDDTVMLLPWWAKEAADEEKDLRKIEAGMKEFEEAGINELKKRCHIIGCSWKQGQEKRILETMISFFAGHNFRVGSEDRMQMLVEYFMARVKCYISSTCILEDLETVKKGIRSVELRADVKKLMRIKADVDPVHQQLEKNTVPTNEVGVGQVMIPLKLPEQEEICLTPPECEDMNQPEQEKNMVDVNFCLTPLWEDMKTEECAIWGRAKRKLAQL